MAFKRTAAAPTRDIYAEVTNRIIADLEAGIASWSKPWGSTGNGSAMPANAVTKRAYSGVNVLILWGAAQASGFTSSRWLTFNQGRDAGGMVRKGSKGTQIVYASTFVPEAERAKGDDAKAVAFLKTFTVFNLDQFDGLDHLRGEVVPASSDQFADAVVAMSPVPVRHGGNSAFYSPAHDFVQMPALAAFPDPLDYSRTLAHELVHSTGHKDRLDRTFGKKFADPHYAREELTAELGAAFICASMGIQPTTRHADYLGHWISVLKEDNRAIFQAASKASKAADYLLKLEAVEMREAA